ncbi:unnamed protein product [Cochlearia groenlandica]
MAALFIGKRGMIKMCRKYNKNVLQSFCCFAAQVSEKNHMLFDLFSLLFDAFCSVVLTRRSSETLFQGSDVAGDSSATMNEARQEAMGTNKDTKPPGVSVSYAADTAKEGIKRAADVAKEQSKNAPATEEEAATATVASGKDEREENVTVGEIGSVKGKKPIFQAKMLKESFFLLKSMK